MNAVLKISCCLRACCRRFLPILIAVMTVSPGGSRARAQSDSNLPPSIVLTNPPYGSIFTFPSIIRLKATASDPDDSIVEVRFYVGTNLVGTVTQPPYSLFLTNVLRDGYYYVLTATALDDRGASSTSSPVRILVTRDFLAPIVSITQPSDGEVLLMPEPFVITATVADDDGSENPVEFFSGTNLIGTVSAPPYTLVVSNLSAGQHRLSAVYTDNLGNRATSQFVHIILTPLTLKCPVQLPDGRFKFRITGLSTGRNFQVQTATNALVWTSIATNFASSNIMDFIDNVGESSALRLYRALQDVTTIP